MTPRQPPSKEGPVPNPDGCVERTKEVPPVSALSLSCRVCATEHPLEAVGTCRKCFGPLDPVYDWDRAARHGHAGAPRGRPSVDLALRGPAPVEAPDEPRLAPGFTPLVPAPLLAEEVGVRELWLKLDTANPTHSFKDRVVAVAARKAQELGFETLSCSSTGNLAGAVAARAAAEGWRRQCSSPPTSSPRSSRRPPRTGRRSTRSTATTTTARGSRSSSRSSFRGASSTSTSARTTPRGRRRSRTRSPSSSTGARRTSSPRRSRRARSSTRSGRDSASFARSV